MRLLFRQGMKNADQQQIQMDGHARNCVRLAPDRNAASQLAKRLRKGRCGCPNGIFDAAPSFSKISEIFFRHYYPLRPGPTLMWPPDPDIENHPVQSSPADVGCAELMKHPRTSNDKISRMQIIRFLTHYEVAGSGLKENYFDSFVPMRIQPPILGSIRIPEADAVKTREDVHGHQGAGIMSFGQRVKFNFAFADGLFLWLAAINPIGLVAH